MHVGFCYSSFKCEICCVIWQSERDGNSVKHSEFHSSVIYLHVPSFICTAVRVVLQTREVPCGFRVRLMYGGINFSKEHVCWM